MSSNVNLETKFIAKRFAISDEDTMDSGSFTIIYTNSLPLLSVFVIFKNSFSAVLDWLLRAVCNAEICM